MKDWKNLKVGDKVCMHTDEFDGITDSDGIIVEVAGDHAIMEDPFGSHEWIDDDTAFMFSW